MSVELLGGFAVQVGGRRVAADAWRHRRAAAVVQMLALAPQHRLAREQVLDALWPDLPPRAGGANLRKAAHHARRTLGLDGAVVLDGGMVRLLPDGVVTTDVERFERCAADALQHDDAAACRQAAALHRGELLPEERYEAWCAQPREQLHATFLAVLAGGQLWGRVVQLEPTDERAHREIMRGHLAVGDRAAAIRQFDALRRVLREELGVSPDPESIALYEQVLAMEGRDVPSPAERARALLAWGVVHWERADVAEAERTAREARALAIDAGLGRELADASELLGLVAYAQGSWRETFGRELLDAVTRTPRLAPFVFDANLCMSEFALQETDGVRAMEQFAGDILQAATDAGSLQARALGLLLRGEVRLLGAGDGQAARGDLVPAVRLSDVGSLTAASALAVERLTQAEAARGLVEDARRLHRRALELAEASAVPEHLLLFVYGGMLGTEDTDAALRVVAEGEAAIAEQGACDPCSMPFRVGAVITCARSGDLSRAREHLREAERISGMWQGGPWHAALKEARAALRLAEGAAAREAAALLHEAAQGYAEADRPADEARTRAAAAALR